MGILEHSRDGTRHQLLSQYIVGRGPRCNLQLRDPLVSNTQAELLWSGTDWQVRDLGSRNGTYVDREPVPDRQPRHLLRGAVIAFGSLDNAFELVDDGPPQAMAIRDDGLQRRARAGTLSLPTVERVACMVIQDGLAWCVEWPDGFRRTVENGAALTIGGHSWRLELPSLLTRTSLARVVIEALRLRFSVSRDECHARLAIHDGRQWLDMDIRVHWYTLVTLARERLADVASGTPDAGAGWMFVDALVARLELTNDTFDQHVFRAKRDFRVHANLFNHSALIERRHKEIRIGVSAAQLEIQVV